MLKAYKLCCGDDNHGMTIRFAERANDLRGHRADGCDCEYIDLRVLRAPKFDDLSPGPVTIEQHLDRGWYWICQHCESQVWSDELGRVIADESVFCSPECFEKHLEMLETWCANGDAHESVVTSRDNLRAAKAAR